MRRTCDIALAGQILSVEVADGAISRMLGLSFRKKAPLDGLLIVFPFRWRWPLWMLGMRFAMDIVWLDGWRVVEIERAVPAPSTLGEAVARHLPPAPVDMALELPAGKFSLPIGERRD